MVGVWLSVAILPGRRAGVTILGGWSRTYMFNDVCHNRKRLITGMFFLPKSLITAAMCVNLPKIALLQLQLWRI